MKDRQFEVYYPLVFVLKRTARSLLAIFPKYHEKDLGQSLKSWGYLPSGWRRFIGNAVPLFGVLAVASFMSPWMNQRLTEVEQVLMVGSILVIIAITVRWRREQKYEIFQHGLTIEQMEKWVRRRFQVCLWKEIESCSLEEYGVKLSPISRFSRAIILYCEGNRTEIYSLCRERIDAYRFGSKESKTSEAFTRGFRNI